MKLRSAKNGTATPVGSGWHIKGESPLQVVFVPAEAAPWDLSRWLLASVTVSNQSDTVVTATGKLNNSKPTGWSRHCPGFAVLPGQTEGSVGFVYPQAEAAYTGPDIFKDQLGKPNGHRHHWRQFFPKDVQALDLTFLSADGTIDLHLQPLTGTHPPDPERDARLHTLPYLDAIGQVRALEWPGKAVSPEAAYQELKAELKAAASQPRDPQFSRFGGWANGPRQEATGHFRTAKVDGKWWFVDPDGYLFFSTGVASAGFEARTPLTQKRKDAGFFAWLPQEKGPLKYLGTPWRNGKQYADFPQMNTMRALGPNWRNIGRAGVHDRLQQWGVNTLGAWADKTLQQDQRTPYTLITSMWWNSNGHRAFPAPFREDYEADLRKALQRVVWAKDDPFCIGVFLGNELDWPDRFTPKAFEFEPGHSTRKWVVSELQKKSPTLDALNTAWETKHSDWDTVLNKTDAIPKQAFADLDPLYFDFAHAFFTKSRRVLNEVLPHKLYLGCRTHRGPNVLGRAAVGALDVYSVNVYDWQARAWQVPPQTDIPILVGEFHFGAPDRGVPSPGLSAVWNQRQRGLAYAHYLASALADPRYVGVHWFRWVDQSAAGRFDRENHQCGFVDVTGRAYPEFTQTVRRATHAMYPARASNEPLLQVLDRLISSENNQE